MIEGIVLRRMAAERRLGLDLIEKDYVLGWILKGISACSVRDKVIFKGGTALSKIYYPLDWRISDDFDFTLLDDSKMEEVLLILQKELPSIIEELSGGIRLTFKDSLLHQDFLRATVSFTGPITRHRTKIEVTREKGLGNYHSINVPTMYDYPDFSLLVYTLDNILAEKLRAIIERTKIRDYYDVWRLLGLKVVDSKLLREKFFEKCEGKDIEFKNVNQFFRYNLINILEPHLEDLTRMSTDLIPPLNEMISDIRENLESIFQVYIN